MDRTFRLAAPVDHALGALPALNRHQAAFIRACVCSFAAISGANVSGESVVTCAGTSLHVRLVHASDPLTIVTFDVGTWEVAACAVGMWDSLRERFSRARGGAFYRAAAEYVDCLLRGRFQKAITYADDVPVRAELRWVDDRYARRVYIPAPQAYCAQLVSARSVRTTTFTYVAFIGNGQHPASTLRAPIVAEAPG